MEKMQELWYSQKDFTNRVLSRLDKPLSELSIDDKTRWTKEYLLSMIDECMEILAQLDWKRHQLKGNKEINLQNVLIEMIDVQKFLWGLEHIWGVRWHELIQVYEDKSFEVEKKWIQNFELEGLETREKICVIDIDGVLIDYPRCFYDWVEEKYHENFVSYKDNRIKYEEYKYHYRASGVKRYLSPISSSTMGLRRLKDKGYTIVLLTNRPYKQYANIIMDTYYWLDSNKISYDFLFWAENRKVISIFGKAREISFIIDDDITTCRDFQNLGIKSYLFGGNSAGDFPRRIGNIGEIDELK